MNKKKIIVCICTYKRPIYLEQCLESLLAQSCEENFEIAVIDNDKNQSASNIIKKINNSKIHYFVENKRGIASARNKCVNICKKNCADYLVFIDDDEIADKNWLKELLCANKRYQSDIIVGPVLCRFEKTPEPWIEKVFFTRKQYNSGQKMRNGATGNVLLNMDVFKHFNDNPFDEKFNFMPGEDTDFFRKLKKINYDIIWCNESIAFENISIIRTKLKSCLIRAFNSGNSTFYIYKMQKNNFVFSLCKSFTELIKILFNIVHIIFYVFLYPIKKFRFIFYKKLYKIVNRCGFISGLFNYKNMYYFETTYGK